MATEETVEVCPVWTNTWGAGSAAAWAESHNHATSTHSQELLLNRFMRLE